MGRKEGKKKRRRKMKIRNEDGKGERNEYVRLKGGFGREFR